MNNLEYYGVKISSAILNETWIMLAKFKISATRVHRYLPKVNLMLLICMLFINYIK